MSAGTYAETKTADGKSRFRCSTCGVTNGDEHWMSGHIVANHAVPAFKDRPSAGEEQAQRSALELEFAAALEQARVFGQVQALEGTAQLAREGVVALDEAMTRLEAGAALAETLGQRNAFKAVLDWCEGEKARLTT